MYYLIGLGNPGKEYESTAHNIGAVLMEMFWQENHCFFGDRRKEDKRKREIVEGMLSEEPITAIFSHSFMNTSGTCLSDVESKDTDKVMVIYDDIDLPFGEVRISFNRGDGGHNGIKDIIKTLKTKEFIRIRVGVAPTDWFGNPRKPKGHLAVANYLTKKKLSKKYMMQYVDIYSTVEEVVLEILRNGRASAMNKFN